MKFSDTIENTNKFNYSVDVRELMDNHRLSKTKIYEMIGRLINRDFGSLDTEKGYRFAKHIEAGDKDIYGVYDDIVIYYDAGADEIDVVTIDEFTTYYKNDWTNPNRGEMHARMSTKRPNQQWKEGQQHEMIKQAKSLYEYPTGLELFIRRGYDVYPYEDYTSVAKMLGEERLNSFRELAQKKNVPVKKLLAIFAHLHSVSNYTIQKAYDWVIKHIDDPHVFATDAKDAAPFEEHTAQGYEIVDLLTIDGRKFIIGKRKYDYFVGAGYDVNDGTWAQGYYDFENAEEALEFINNHYKTRYYQE